MNSVPYARWELVCFAVMGLIVVALLLLRF